MADEPGTGTATAVAPGSAAQPGTVQAGSGVGADNGGQPANGNGNGNGASGAIPADAANNATSNNLGAVEFNVPKLATDDAKLFNDFVPAEYKDQPWVKEISKSANPRVEIFKQIENKDKLLGQRVLQVPAADAPEAEKKAFNKLIGVPDAATEYVYEGYQATDEADKVLAKQLNDSRPAAFMEEIKKACLEEGVPLKTFQKMLAKNDELIIKYGKDQMIQAAKAEQGKDASFQKLIETTYGTDSQTVLDTGKKMLDRTLPTALKPMLKTLTPEQLLVVASAMHGAHKLYVREDTFNTGSNTVNTGFSPKERRAALMRDPAYTDFRNPNHTKVKGEIDSLNKQMRDAGKVW